MKPELLLSYACRLAAMVGILCSSEPTVAQSSPRLLPFQGRVTDAQGAALPDGPRVIRFRISESPVDNTFRWPGELHRASVNGGLINLVLGTRTPLEGIDFGRQLYLEITVDADGDGTITAADPPMLPRQAILPVLFAKEAEDSRQLAGHDWSVILAGGATDPSVGRIAGAKLEVGGIPSDAIGEGVVQGRHLALGAVSEAQLADRSVTWQKLAPRQSGGPDVRAGGVAISIGTSDSWTSPTPSLLTTVPGMEIALETTGRPVSLWFTSGTNGLVTSSIYAERDGNANVVVRLLRRDSRGTTVVVSEQVHVNFNGASMRVTPGAFQFLDTPSADRMAYFVQARALSSNGLKVEFNAIRLVAMEL